MMGTLCAMPAHPFSIGIGGGIGWVNWNALVAQYSDTDPIISDEHLYNPDDGIYVGSPAKAGGNTYALTAHVAWQFSQHMSLQSDYFYLGDTAVQFDMNKMVIHLPIPQTKITAKNIYPELPADGRFTTHNDAMDLTLKFNAPTTLIKHLDVFTDLGLGVVHRHDILAHIYRIGGTFGLGLNYRINPHWSTDCAFMYFTGYDRSVPDPAHYFTPFLDSIYVNLNYHFGPA